jgi:hypothetical protein
MDTVGVGLENAQGGIGVSPHHTCSTAGKASNTPTHKILT